MLKERCLPEHIAGIRERSDCYVAELEGRVVGYMALCGYGIEELWVEPSYHRQGMGTALFEHAERRSAEGNATGRVCCQDRQTCLAEPFGASQEPEKDDREHGHTRSGH